MDLHIIPECYIDTKLIKALIPPTTRYNHQKGCPNVVKVMQQNLGGDFALGIIDRDKKELGYADEFDLMYEISNNIQLFKHKSRNHYLIFICPAVEKWIITNASEANLNLNDFGLPNDFRKLTDITKTSKSEKEDPYSKNFHELFKKLRETQPKAVQLLIFWVKYLKDNPYDADIDFLRDQSSIIANP